MNDGGSAFPESYIGFDRPHEGIGNGMTLRDYFAAKAMQSLAMQSGYDKFIYLAQDAYAIADAMLAARQEGSK